MEERKKYRGYLLSILFFFTLVRLLYIGTIPISPDEAYYWSWSQKPAISYFDQPGMVAWVNWLFNHLPGAPNEFTVRLPAVILMFFTGLFSFATYLEFSHKPKPAFFLAVGLNFIPIYFLSGLTMLHDTVLIFFLAGFYYFVLRLINQPALKNWLGLGIFLLASLYSKLNALWVGVGLAGYLVFTRPGRGYLKTPGPWLAGAINLFGFAPVLWWNYKNNFPHLLAIRQLTDSGKITLIKALKHLGEYLGSQFGVYSPLVMLGIILSVLYALKSLKKTQREKIPVLLFLSLPAQIYFLLLCIRSEVFGNWSLVGYFPLILLFCYFCFEEKKPLLTKKYYHLAIGLSALLCLGLAVEAKYRFARALSWELKEKFHLERPLDWRLDQELEGWNELVQAVEKHRKPDEALSSRRYQIASVLQFYLAEHPEVVVISAGHKKSQFNLWHHPRELAGKNVLYVDAKPMPHQVKKRFSRVIDLEAPLKIYRQGKLIKVFYLQRGINYHPKNPRIDKLNRKSLK